MNTTNTTPDLNLTPARLNDTRLNVDAAMQILSMRSTVCVHHLRVKVGRASRWHKSDINAYIAALEL